MVEGHVRTLISWGCKPSADKPRPFFLTFLFPSCLTFLSQCITFIFPFLPQTPPPPRCCLSSRGGLASLRRCSRTRCGLNELSAECRRAGRDKQDNELHCRKPCFKVLLPFALSAVVWEAFFEGGFFWLIVDVFNSRGLWGEGRGGRRNTPTPLPRLGCKTKDSIYWRRPPASKARLRCGCTFGRRESCCWRSTKFLPIGNVTLRVGGRGGGHNVRIHPPCRRNLLLNTRRHLISLNGKQKRRRQSLGVQTLRLLLTESFFFNINSPGCLSFFL